MPQLYDVLSLELPGSRLSARLMRRPGLIAMYCLLVCVCLAALFRVFRRRQRAAVLAATLVKTQAGDECVESDRMVLRDSEGVTPAPAP